MKNFFITFFLTIIFSVNGYTLDDAKYSSEDIRAVINSSSWQTSVDKIKSQYQLNDFACYIHLGSLNWLRDYGKRKQKTDLSLTIGCSGKNLVEYKDKSIFPFELGFNLKAKIRINKEKIDDSLEIIDFKVNPSVNSQTQSHMGEFTCSNSFGDTFTMEVTYGSKFIYNYPSKIINQNGSKAFEEMLMDSGVCRIILASLLVGDGMFNPYVSKYQCGPLSFPIYYSKDNGSLSTALHPTTISVLFTYYAPKAGWFCRYEK